MTPVEILHIGPEQMELLLDWRMRVLHDVFADSHAPDWEALRRANRLYYAEAIPTGHHIAAMARMGREYVGCGGVCFQREMPSPDNPSGLCAYLMNIYVEPGSRGIGIGRKIVDHLVAESRTRGADKIYLETSPDGRNLYTSMGFTPMPDMMHLPNLTT